MTNTKNSSIRNLVFPCNICEKNANDKDDTI